MKEFNEARSTNDYLTGELILARQANDIMTENNRRLEKLLVKAIRDLQDAGRLLNALSNSVNNLTNLVTGQIVKR
jgi:galactokinase